MTAKNNRLVSVAFDVEWTNLMAVYSAVLNICMPYASRDDMATAIQSSARELLKEDHNVLCVISASFLSFFGINGAPHFAVLSRKTILKSIL